MNSHLTAQHSEQPATERGQSMVEFALGLIILLMLLAGIVDAGRALFTYMALRDAAQEGALYGSLDPQNEAQIRARVRGSSTFVNNIIDDGDIAISFIGPRCIGNGITVAVTMDDFRLVMPFLGTVMGTQSISISADVTDTILRPFNCPP